MTNKTNIQTHFIQKMRKLLVSRRILPVVKPEGSFDYAEIEQSGILQTLQNYDVSSANGFWLSETKYGPVYWKDITINTNHSIKRIIECLAHRAAEFEDHMVFAGQHGLYEKAGNCYGERKDFGTYGNATDAVLDSIRLIELDTCKIEQGYNLFLNNAQLVEIICSVSSDTGIREMQHVETVLRSGRVYDARMSEGTGLLILNRISKDEMFIPLMMDWRLLELPNHKYRICVSMFPPVVKCPNVLCQLRYI